MNKKFVTFIFVLVCAVGSAQDYDIGIRAGLNFSKFIGPSETEVNENFGIVGGFHFGINFQWNFNPIIGIRSEVMYQQIGSHYKYEGDGYYVFRLRTIPRFVVKDRSDIELDISNAHISFPLTAHLTITEKLEIFGGGYFSFLVSPVATGKHIFGAQGELAPDYAFEQGLDFNYRSDVAAEFNLFARSIGIIVNDQNVDLHGIVGAYYLYDEIVQTKKYKGSDYGLVGGFSYYLNRGLYVGARVEYGMTDITNTGGDISYKNVNPDGTFIFNDDYDRNLNIALSIGFRF